MAGNPWVVLRQTPAGGLAYITGHVVAYQTGYPGCMLIGPLYLFYPDNASFLQYYKHMVIVICGSSTYFSLIHIRCHGYITKAVSDTSLIQNFQN